MDNTKKMENIIPIVQQLNDALAQLKQKFVGKDEIIDLMGICLVARENLFLLGPPGTAKSAMVRGLAELIHGKSFEYLLTRFTEPNELFGPFDIRKLKNGELITNTEGMLPEADLVFLDELLNANSAILNSLLTVLNERIFKRGKETQQLPALLIVGASNQLPEDEALQALFDRFLVRVKCDNVAPDMLSQVLDAGWALERPNNKQVITITAEAIKSLQQAMVKVDLNPTRPLFLELIQQMRNAGVRISDRRAVKIQRLIAASALVSERDIAQPSDLWVMRYVWDIEEQIEVIHGMVSHLIKADGPWIQHHPQAYQKQLPNPDDIYDEVAQLKAKWDDIHLPNTERSVIKDRLRYLNNRVAWITNDTTRSYVQKPIDDLWQTIIKSP